MTFAGCSVGGHPGVTAAASASIGLLTFRSWGGGGPDEDGASLAPLPKAASSSVSNSDSAIVSGRRVASRRMIVSCGS